MDVRVFDRANRAIHETKCLFARRNYGKLCAVQSHRSFEREFRYVTRGFRRQDQQCFIE